MKMAKMSIIEFCEEALDTKLLDWQKDFVMKMYEACKTKKRLYYIPARGSKHYPIMLTILTAMYCEMECGSYKEKFSNLVKEVGDENAE